MQVVNNGRHGNRNQQLMRTRGTPTTVPTTAAAVAAATTQTKETVVQINGGEIQAKV